MKKFIVLLMLFIPCLVSAQVIKFRTIRFSYHYYDNRTMSWHDWADWQNSNMILTINLDNDVVTIYSPVTQRYQITESQDTYYDSDGDLNIVFKFIDQDNDIGLFRILQRTSGVSEVYIQFNDVEWCYRVLRI